MNSEPGRVMHRLEVLGPPIPEVDNVPEDRLPDSDLAPVSAYEGNSEPVIGSGGPTLMMELASRGKRSVSRACKELKDSAKDLGWKGIDGHVAIAARLYFGMRLVPCRLNPLGSITEGDRDVCQLVPVNTSSLHSSA